VRESIESNVAAIAAKRDYFIATVDFQTAIIGGGGSSGAEGEAPAMSTAAEGGEH
jgi:hypothetical protein